MNWQIKNYKTADTGGAIAGRFTLVVGPMEIRGWTHFRKDDGSEWVNGPQRQFERDGEMKYFNFCYIEDKDKWKNFQKWALSEIKKLAPATTAPDPTPVGDDIPF